MKKIGLCSLERCGNGLLTIEVKVSNKKRRISSVPENIIRCAVGEEDMAYLLGEQISDDYVEDETPIEDKFVVPSNDEGMCFSLSYSELKDCLKHGELERDLW